MRPRDTLMPPTNGDMMLSISQNTWIKAGIQSLDEAIGSLTKALDFTPERVGGHMLDSRFIEHARTGGAGLDNARIAVEQLVPAHHALATGLKEHALEIALTDITMPSSVVRAIENARFTRNVLQGSLT